MRSLRRLALRATGPILGLTLLSSIGSCELPKPQLPSIGVAPAAAPGGAGTIRAVALARTGGVR
jgi:hypothetical protein